MMIMMMLMIKSTTRHRTAESEARLRPGYAGPLYILAPSFHCTSNINPAQLFAHTYIYIHIYTAQRHTSASAARALVVVYIHTHFI